MATFLAGLIGFAAAHALLIVPIWTRLLRGIPFGLPAGIALAGAFDRIACLNDAGLRPTPRLGRSVPSHDAQTASWGPRLAGALCAPTHWHSLADGARFGAVMYATLLPSTVLAAGLRLNGVHVGESNLVFAASLILVVLAGSCAGWLLAHRRDAAIACGLASLSLLLASAGPLPAAQSPRGFWLSVAVAPVCVGACAVLALVRGFLMHRNES